MSALPHSRLHFISDCLHSYLLAFPFLFLLSKSPSSSLQTVLHVLFLPSPLKRAHAVLNATLNPDSTAPAADAEGDGKGGETAEGAKPPLVRIVDEEVLKPGTLYRECAVVQQVVPGLPLSNAGVNGKQEAKGKEKSKPAESSFPDDGELGGEAVGRVVWEWYEARLKLWEATTESTDTKPSSNESSEKDAAMPAS